MADDLTGGIWEIDSVGIKSTSSVYIERIAWKNASLAGHTVRIVDQSGKLIWEHFAPGAIANTSEPIGKSYQGFQVTALSSGKLYVTHR